MDETNLILPLSQCLHDAVYAVTGKAKDNFNAPIDEGIHENICGCKGHFFLSIPRRRRLC